MIKPIQHWKALRARLTPPAPWRWVLCILTALLSGAFLAALTFLTSEGSQMLARLFSPAVLLCALFLGLLVLFLTLLLHSVFLGYLIVAAPMMLLAVADYLKTMLTTVPITLSDLTLVGQAGHIAELNKDVLVLSRSSTAAIVAAILWLVILFFLSGSIRPQWGFGVLASVLPAAALVLLFWAGAPNVYAALNTDVAQAIPQWMAKRDCGVVLAMWRSIYISATRDDKALSNTPEAVTRRVEELTMDMPQQPEKDKPNIIFILSESFMDVTKLDGVSFAEDPIPEFHALKDESVSGTFYSRSLGYGTCSVELEVFTGLESAFLDGSELYSWGPETFGRLPSVPQVLRDNGYYTALVHTYNDSIYNRTKNFSALGFDDMFFTGDYAEFYQPAADAPDYLAYIMQFIKSRYYSDDFLADLLIGLYEGKKEEGPVFLYGLSMENHQGYTDKFTEEELDTPRPQSNLTGEAANILLNLTQGLHDASASLGKLVDYFRDVDEPVVLVFYGDHRPGLGLAKGGTVYTELGIVPKSTSEWTADQFAMMYSTDYLIWSNDDRYLPAERGSTMETSSNFLGSLLLDITGVERPLYWKFLSRLSQERVIDNYLYHRDRSGVNSLLPPAVGEGSEALWLMRDIITDTVKGEHAMADKLREIPDY